MSSLTDPKGIQATARAIYEGGREHPLADLARLIDGAIHDARFQGLADFDIARWVAHAITEDQKARLAYSDATAPHGQFVPNPPRPTRSATTPDPKLSPETLSMIERESTRGGLLEFPTSTETRNAEQFLMDQVPDAGEYPHMEWNDSRPVTVTPMPRGVWDFLADMVPPLPPVKTGDQPSMFEAFKAGTLTYGEVPELPPFPKLDLSGIPAMPADVKESLERASEQMRESMERAAKAVRKGIDEAKAAEARRILAAQPHEHIYGRGSNGLCRICGHESNSRRARAKRREIHNAKAKAARQYPQHVPSEKVTYTKDGDAKGLAGTVLIPADHNGMVLVAWETGAEGLTPVQHISAPDSGLYEALKAKGDGGE